MDEINTKEEIAEKNPEELLTEQKDYYLRIIADYENRMKRVKIDAQRSIDLTLEAITLDLIPLLQDLSSALVLAEGEIKTGIELIDKNLTNILKKYGVEEIHPKIGDEFDPNLHHAIMIEKKENFEEGKIVKLIQIGYKLHNNKIVSPALVEISS